MTVPQDSSSPPPRFPALFLDRDGVIIENRPNYVRSWDDVALIPGALEALALAAASDYRVIIITNQAGVGKGLIPAETAEDINRRLADRIHAQGGRVDGVFMCPHRPKDRCACRKPKPGLLLQAVETLHVDPARSVLIGDALTDLEAGHRAGVGRLALVLTGRGEEQARLDPPPDLGPFEVYADLRSALNALLAPSGKQRRPLG